MKRFLAFFLLASTSAFVPSKKSSVKTCAPHQHISTKLSSFNNATFDPVEKYAEFVGFEPEKKWKAVRYTLYYWAGFEVLSEAFNRWREYNNNPFH
tara:strand:- start:1382 stop:1669 length:288 start_codon:yes stop_codon:yes gene_type:complete